MTNKETTQLLLPGGEWLQSIVTAFALLDLELKRVADSSRCYGYMFAEQRKPSIVFNIFRSRDIPTMLKADRPAGGFTGTDILSEADIAPSWIFGLVSSLIAPTPQLYLGVVPQVWENVKEPTVQDAAKGTVYTTYPNITTKYFQEIGLSPRIAYLAGKIERVWDSDSSATGIVDIGQSLKTAQANEIKPISTVMDNLQVAFIEKPDISPIDRFRIDCLQGDIYKKSRRISSKR